MDIKKFENIENNTKKNHMEKHQSKCRKNNQKLFKLRKGKTRPIPQKKINFCNHRIFFFKNPFWISSLGYQNHKI